jgi:DNA-directed RNA polymerase subunit RPC12/RpoP
MKSDYISREAAANRAFDAEHEANEDGAYREAEVLHALGVAMMDIPAADVAPVRHGRWELSPRPASIGLGEWPYRCSKCGMPLVALEPDQAPYCHCGARMDAPKEEEYAE